MSARTAKLKHGSFAFDTLILAIAAIVAKILGAAYRIPLTNILGAEGIGLYQLIFPIYALFLTLSSSAIPTALSRIISSRTEKNSDISIALAKRSATRSMLLLSAIAAVILVILAYPIALVQGNASIRYGYYIIAPSIVVVALANCVKGYFQGKLNMFPTALAQIIEQVVKLVAGLLLAYFFIKHSVFAAVLASIFGVLLSEIVSLLILATQYFYAPRPTVVLPIKTPRGYYKILMHVTLPILLSGLFFPIVQFADSLLIVNLLKLKGADIVSATSQYGLLSGSVMTLINMPIVIILSVAIAIVPYIARKKAEHNCPSIAHSTTKSLININRLALPCAIGFALLARPIIDFFYPSQSMQSRELSAMLMQIAAVTILLIPNMQLFASMLQGLGRGKSVAYNMLIGCLLKVALDTLLIYYFGVQGALYASIICYVFILIINYIIYRRLMGIGGKLPPDILSQTVNAIIMGLVISLSIVSGQSALLTLVLSGGSGILIYTFMTAFGLQTAKETKAIGNIALYRTKRSAR